MAPHIEARNGARKRERDEQAQKTENCAFDNARALYSACRIRSYPSHGDAVTEVLHGQHPEKQSNGKRYRSKHHRRAWCSRSAPCPPPGESPFLRCQPYTFTAGCQCVSKNLPILLLLTLLPKVHSWVRTGRRSCGSDSVVD